MGDLIQLPTPEPVVPRISRDSSGQFWLEGALLKAGDQIEVTTENRSHDPELDRLVPLPRAEPTDEDDDDFSSEEEAVFEAHFKDCSGPEEETWMLGTVRESLAGVLKFWGRHYRYAGDVRPGWKAQRVELGRPTRDTEELRSQKYKRIMRPRR